MVSIVWTMKALRITLKETPLNTAVAMATHTIITKRLPVFSSRWGPEPMAVVRTSVGLLMAFPFMAIGPQMGCSSSAVAQLVPTQNIVLMSVAAIMAMIGVTSSCIATS